MNTISRVVLLGTVCALAGCSWFKGSGTPATASTAAAEAEAAAAAAAAAEMAAMNAPQEFTVYFGFDRSDLTVLGSALVSDAVAAFEPGKKVSVIGHADTVGTLEYNQTLSEARALTVAKALVSGGVRRGAITASGRGELDLAIATDDEVREPLNRRADITVAK